MWRPPAELVSHASLLRLRGTGVREMTSDLATQAPSSYAEKLLHKAEHDVINIFFSPEAHTYIMYIQQNHQYLRPIHNGTE